MRTRGSARRADRTMEEFIHVPARRRREDERISTTCRQNDGGIPSRLEGGALGPPIARLFMRDGSSARLLQRLCSYCPVHTLILASCLNVCAKCAERGDSGLVARWVHGCRCIHLLHPARDPRVSGTWSSRRPIIVSSHRHITHAQHLPARTRRSRETRDGKRGKWGQRRWERPRLAAWRPTAVCHGTEELRAAA